MAHFAVDIGTTSIKGAIVDGERQEVGKIHRVRFPEPLSGRPPLFHEVDPLKVVDAVRDLFRRLLDETPEIAGLVLCGQMGGLVLTSETGKPLSNYISWLDKRPLMPHPSGRGSYFDVFLERVGEDRCRRLGNLLRPGLPLPYLFWLAENRELPDRDAIPVTLPEFVASHLSNSCPVIEWTSTTGSLDLEERDWPWALLSELKLDGLRWPQIVDVNHVVGRCDLGALKVPVYAPVGDHQCALTGTLLRGDELSVNISTGSQVAVISEELEFGDYHVRPFFDGRFLKAVTHIPAGRALNELVDLLSEIAASQNRELEDPWPYILAEAEAAEETDLDVDLGFFPGAVAGPGHLSNLSEGNLRVGHLFRAAFEKMAEYYETFALRLSPARTWKRLVFSGGLAQRSVLLRRLVCQRLGSEHRLSPSTEDTLLGLLVLARVASGSEPSVRAASDSLRRKIEKTG